MDRLETGHQEALAFTNASERMRFLQNTLAELYTALCALRAAEQQLLACNPCSVEDTIAQRTRSELRSAAPPTLLSPGRALIAGDLDLLQLVAYTGASHALIQERTRQIIDRSAYQSQENSQDGGTVV